ncbi:fimbrial protein [Amantichitinum ursilacus]|uniref:Fimbrial protein n=1 Tax=Amantichitinum ursilacus TaxID=857265 RepID=A0A0N1JRI9_9NEIS|nr:fimbrial protein [Amantichitinum ursilacus]KPC49786.1 Fimbrial protein [Amantichitinum ursilacus]
MSLFQSRLISPALAAWRKRLMLLGVLLLTLLPALAQAACVNASGRYNTLLNVVARSVRVQADLAEGASLGAWSSTAVASGAQRSINYGLINCTGGGGSFGWMGDAVAGAGGVYPTGVPGIGIRFRLSGILVDQAHGVVMPVSLESGGARIPLADGKYLGNTVPWIFTYTLVKTGPIALNAVKPYATFNLASAGLENVWVGGDGDTVQGGAASRYVPFSLSAPGDWALVPATCFVTTPVMTVPLNSALLRFFQNNEQNIGLTPFNVGLTCPGGAQSLKRVSMLLSDNVKLGNSSNTLALTLDSTASGVGIQVLWQGAPVQFQADPTDTTGTTPASTLAVGTISGGSFNIPLSARYIATEGNENVEVGTVNARMTLTVYYD